jgi:hypothetical protein
VKPIIPSTDRVIDDSGEVTKEQWRLLMEKHYTFYWRDGKREMLRGIDPADALSKRGYGNGALRALDFYAEGENREYDWDKDLRCWKKEP